MTAPEAILRVSDALHARDDKPDSYVFLGVVGDVNHSFGYHLAGEQLDHSDYSMQLDRDVTGAKAGPQFASAWDLGFNADDMLLVTRRLLAAAIARDSRLHGVREFCGTTNGSNPHPYDLSRHFDDPNNTEGWDQSHCSHVHISFYRDVCDDFEAIRHVVDVICGGQPDPLEEIMAFYESRQDFEAAMEKLMETAINKRLLADADHPLGLPNSPGVDLHDLRRGIEQIAQSAQGAAHKK